MPIYEYKCLKCGSRIEVRQQISDEPLSVCEECGGKLEKQISLSGFQFKGGGWYVSDYSNKGKPETKADTVSEKPVDVKSTTSTETASKPKEESKKSSSKDEKKAK